MRYTIIILLAFSFLCSCKKYAFEGNTPPTYLIGTWYQVNTDPWYHYKITIDENGEVTQVYNNSVDNTDRCPCTTEGRLQYIDSTLVLETKPPRYYRNHPFDRKSRFTKIQITTPITNLQLPADTTVYLEQDGGTNTYDDYIIVEYSSFKYLWVRPE